MDSRNNKNKTKKAKKKSSGGGGGGGDGGEDNGGGGGGGSSGSSSKAEKGKKKGADSTHKVGGVTVPDLLKPHHKTTINDNRTAATAGRRKARCPVTRCIARAPSATSPFTAARCARSFTGSTTGRIA